MVEEVLLTVIRLIALEVVEMDLQTAQDLIAQLLLARILLIIHRHLTQVSKALAKIATHHQTLPLALEGYSSDLDKT